jgi:hypothetical protein
MAKIAEDWKVVYSNKIVKVDKTGYSWKDVVRWLYPTKKNSIDKK